MRRLKILIICILIFTMSVLFIACNKNASIYDIQPNEGRFTVKYEGENLSIDIYSINDELYALIEGNSELLPILNKGKVITNDQFYEIENGNTGVDIKELKPYNENFEDKIGLFINDDLSLVDEDLKRPEQTNIGTICYIYKIKENLAYVDVLEQFFDSPATIDYAVGYVPIENIIVGPSVEELESLSNYCHIKKGTIEVIDSVNSEKYEINGGFYAEILELKDDSVLIGSAGGANPYWISKSDIDYDFDDFKGYPENWHTIDK